eukprot:CAMPEP_0181234404 /NCGR_PEP_ID=MMETSP1096-20121128/36941_1 /TAXON_ID=156174 ORGANISM="Chrysochromulina ericina, Strain CCMP281" /NCGR_SAMPLE_ID=MMETSP1096 /ASSEMBLY_ACC=CAM_ASM_000453 /LENGTH=69 /DNA_ID=CAMNT_0023329149 /DNA_START=638 /DNA_END=844 /DNA_ORIENTATION=+
MWQANALSRRNALSCRICLTLSRSSEIVTAVKMSFLKPPVPGRAQKRSSRCKGRCAALRSEHPNSATLR